MTCCSSLGMLVTLASMGLLKVSGSVIGSVEENGTVTDSNETVLEKAKTMNHSTDNLAELKCSFQSFPRDHTIQANAIGADSSIYPNYATNAEMNFGVDMAGLWWMMGNVLAEEFVSWKGSTSDSPNSFPMKMTSPTNLVANWVWPDSLNGRFLMSYYALTEEPSVPQILSWVNSSYAKIVPIVGSSTADSGSQYILRKNESDTSGDTWIRENADSPDDTEPEYAYTLVRVVNGDGTANSKWWPEFEKYADELGISSLQIWGNDNACMRACEISNVCSFCKWYCGDDSGGDVSHAQGTGTHLAYSFLFSWWYTMLSGTRLL